MYKILFIDDDILICTDYVKQIENLGYVPDVAYSENQAIKLISMNQYDVIFTDQKLKDGDGLAILKIALDKDPYLPIIVLTGYGEVDLAVRAMKYGAYEYIEKPLDIKTLETLLDNAILYRKSRLESANLQHIFTEKSNLQNMIYQSTIMRQIARNIIKMSNSNANVLIFGESGTGKELIARNIHFFSQRKNQPFIPVDCAAFPATLLESELFGFEKGSFTGATYSKPGLFEQASEGTLFLDEVTEIDLHMQPKLLRVLQERKLRRIGGKHLIDIDIRIISATNRDPEEAVNKNILREDLYYRLNVIPIYIPPLRDRSEDISLLVHHFINKYNPFSHVEVKKISQKAMTRMEQYTWPGNIRELENCIYRILSLIEHDTIQEDDLPPSIANNQKGPFNDAFLEMKYSDAKEKWLEEMGKIYFSKMFKRFDGNITKIAEFTGTSRKTVYRFIEKYSLHT